MRPSTSSQSVVSAIIVWISWSGGAASRPLCARLSLSPWSHFARFLQSRRRNSAGTARRKAFRHAGIPEKSACSAVQRRKPACFPQFFPQVWKTSGTDPSPRAFSAGRCSPDDCSRGIDNSTSKLAVRTAQRRIHRSHQRRSARYAADVHPELRIAHSELN